MSCPHGHNSSPDTCSQCLGAPARKVVQDGGALYLDGRRLGTMRELIEAREAGQHQASYATHSSVSPRNYKRRSPTG